MHPARVGSHSSIRGAAGSDSLFCAWLLRKRQSVLPHVGRHQSHAGVLSRVDAGASPRRKRLLRLPAQTDGGRGKAVKATTTERMTIASSRRLKDGDVCFVGIGLPSTAANLARLTPAPHSVLIFAKRPL